MRLFTSVLLLVGITFELTPLVVTFLILLDKIKFQELNYLIAAIFFLWIICLAIGTLFLVSVYSLLSKQRNQL